MTFSAYVEDPTVAITMSDEVNAAIVAAVAAGDSTSAFATGGLNSIESLDAATLETMVSANTRLSRLKRTAAEDAETINDSVKLRKLQEEVNNNANAAAQASGILSSGASLSNGSSGSSTQNSPNLSNTGDANGTATGSSDVSQTQVSSVVQEAITVATTTHLTASSHSSIMADLERMQQLAKIDPAQLASYSTNPNNQATLEQLTSSALANVLAQAPLTVGNLQIHQEHGQPQPQGAVQGILMTMPAAVENADDDCASSAEEEETLSSKRARNRDATNEERRQRRLLRNRVAAKECRKKKKAYIQELQDTCARLQEENARLYKENEELNAKLTLGAMRIDENVRLIKEVEELNAKLTLGVMAGATAHAHVQDSIAADVQAPRKDDGTGEESSTEPSASGDQPPAVTEALQHLAGGSA